MQPTLYKINLIITTLKYKLQIPISLLMTISRLLEAVLMTIYQLLEAVLMTICRLLEAVLKTISRLLEAGSSGRTFSDNLVPQFFCWVSEQEARYSRCGPDGSVICVGSLHRRLCSRRKLRILPLFTSSLIVISNNTPASIQKENANIFNTVSQMLRLVWPPKYVKGRFWGKDLRVVYIRSSLPNNYIEKKMTKKNPFKTCVSLMTTELLLNKEKKNL